MGKLFLALLFSSLAAVDLLAGIVEVSNADGLRNALSNAADGDTVVLAPGDYLLSSPLSVSKENITLTSKSGKAATFIDADSKCRILEVSGVRFKVEGITFKNAFYNGDGGAIWFSGSSISKTAVVSNCDFVDCKAYYGGGIYAGQNSYTSFEPRENYGLVSGCTFLRCGIIGPDEDAHGGGGAIFGALWVENSVFDACFCSGKLQYHAAIDVSRYSTVTNCVFRNHSKTKRGLIGGSERYSETQENGCVRLIDCLIANNTFTDNDDIFFHRKVILDRCVISNNTSVVEWNSVGLYRIVGDEEREFSKALNCLFIDNKYPFNMLNLPTLVNCSFVRNAGGLACDMLGGTALKLAVTNCVLWGNSAKADWPHGATYRGVPGLYWHPLNEQIASQIRIANVVVEGGSVNDDVLAVLQADSSGKSESLTALAAEKGPGFKDSEKGDWSLRKSSVLIDGGVRYEGIDGMKDLANNPRALKSGVLYPGALPDIGCYEYYSIPGLCILVR